MQHVQPAPTFSVHELTMGCILAGSLATTCDLTDVLTHLLDRLRSKEGRKGFQASRHVLVDPLAVLHHAMVTHSGAQHGVPGPMLQQQVMPFYVNHARNMLVPAEECFSSYCLWCVSATTVGAGFLHMLILTQRVSDLCYLWSFTMSRVLVTL